jgi:hypothetical protein
LNDCDPFAPPTDERIDLPLGDARGMIQPSPSPEGVFGASVHDRYASIWLLEPLFARLFARELSILFRQMIAYEQLFISIRKPLQPWWCGDHIEPARLIDPGSGAGLPPAACLEARPIFTFGDSQVRLLAPLFIHGQVGVLTGELAVASAMTEPELCETVDVTGDQRRYVARAGTIACDAISRARIATAEFQNEPSNPAYRDEVRGWFNLLSYLEALTSAP